MSKILVPLDETSLSRAALPVAEWLARGTGSQLVLLHITAKTETNRQEAEAMAEAERVLEPVAERLAGIPIVTAADSSGDPARGIVRAAQEAGVDLIVMATRARGAVGQMAYGSVAEDVLQSGVAPVTLVNAGDED